VRYSTQFADDFRSGLAIINGQNEMISTDNLNNIRKGPQPA
jgi:hypothetical protein